MSPEIAITHQPKSRGAVSSNGSSERIINTQQQTIREQYIALNEARECIQDAFRELVAGNEGNALFEMRQYLRSVGL